MIPRMERQDKRLVDQLRPISFETGIAPNATASVLVTFGRTKVICAVTIEEDVFAEKYADEEEPPFA